MSIGLGPVTQLNAARRAAADDRAVTWDECVISFKMQSKKTHEELAALVRIFVGWPWGWTVRNISSSSSTGNRYTIMFNVEGEARAADGASARAALNLMA